MMSRLAVRSAIFFALVNRLRPALAPAGARVVSVSSSGHFLSGIRWDDPHFHRDYDHWAAYGQSKIANALFAVHLDELGTSDGFKTPAQGAATAVWAATSPLLDEYGGAYCQDCDIAEPAVDDDMLHGGVKPWATDPAAAARLWTLSAELTGHDGFADRRALAR